MSMRQVKALAATIAVTAAVAFATPQSAEARWGGGGWHGGWGGGGWHGGWGGWRGGWGGWHGGWGGWRGGGWGWGAAAVGAGVVAGALASPYYGYGYGYGDPGYYSYSYPAYYGYGGCYLRRVWGPSGPHLVRVCY